MKNQLRTQNKAKILKKNKTKQKKPSFKKKNKEGDSDTNELIYKTETDLQILKTDLWLPKRKRGGEE